MKLLYRYADKYYKGKNDKVSKEKMAILNRMVKTVITWGRFMSKIVLTFLAGMTPEEVAKLGYDCYVESYQGKFTRK